MLHYTVLDVHRKDAGDAAAEHEHQGADDEFAHKENDDEWKVLEEEFEINKVLQLIRWPDDLQ